jgi:hypothetical protein
MNKSTKFLQSRLHFDQITDLEAYRMRFSWYH